MFEDDRSTRSSMMENNTSSLIISSSIASSINSTNSSGSSNNNINSNGNISSNNITTPIRCCSNPSSVRRTIIVVLLVTGAILDSFVGLTLAMHHAFASDGWNEQVDQAESIFETLWVLSLIISSVAVVSICTHGGGAASSSSSSSISGSSIRRHHHPYPYRNDHTFATFILWMLLLGVAIANLFAVWWYLYQINQNSSSNPLPIKSWILSAVPCCLWIWATIIKFLDRIINILPSSSSSSSSSNNNNRRKGGISTTAEIQSVSREPLLGLV